MFYEQYNFQQIDAPETKFFPILSDLSQVILATSDLMIENIRQNNHASFIEYAKKIKEKERHSKE